MVKRQSFNKKTKAWVVFEFKKDGKAKFVNVKQKNPTVPFKNIKITRKSMKFK